MTPIDAIVPVEQLSGRAAGYGMPGVTIDGDDPVVVRDAVAEAAARARAGGGPSFIEARCHRLGAHYNGDVEHYRPQADRDAAVAADPVAALRRRLLADGAGESELAALEREVDEQLDAACDAAVAAPPPDPSGARDHVHGQPAGAADTGEPASEQELTYVKAVTEALRRELRARPDVVVYGEDVGASGGIFGATRQLQDQFGAERVFDSPIAESAILGSAVGAALEGLRPVVEIMWGDFLLVALDQLINQAANVRYVSRGEHCAPLVVRTQQGATPGSSAQHSQSLEALLAHIPGLRVGVAATPHDAHAMLRAAIADDDPVILFESRALYQHKGNVRLGGEREGVGGARLRREGGDVAIVSWGSAALLAQAAAEQLAADGIDATVLDLRWLAPLDDAAIAAAVERTGRVLVAHEANGRGASARRSPRGSASGRSMRSMRPCGVWARSTRGSRRHRDCERRWCLRPTGSRAPRPNSCGWVDGAFTSGGGETVSNEEMLQAMVRRATRRRFLQRAGGLSLGALALPGLLAACGDDEEGGSTTTAEKTAGPAEVPKASGRLDYLSWEGYDIPDAMKRGLRPTRSSLRRTTSPTTTTSRGRSRRPAARAAST
jgi:pyruvate/2-oxoglutarate/acetoin dehydrogenase E1 component